MTGLTALEAEAYIRDHLPLAATMDVRVLDLGLDGTGAGGPSLAAPLAANANHLGTAFGGSIATLAILTGWVAVHYRLLAAGHEARTVVQRTSMEYLAPATHDLRARCAPIDPDAWSRLLRAYERRGRGRVAVEVTVMSGGDTVARFKGDYVAASD